MKRAYALPAIFSATVLAFPFFGLSDAKSRPPVPPAEPAPANPPPLWDKLLAVVDPPASVDGEDDRTKEGSQAGEAPRLPEIPVLNPPPGIPVIPALPPNNPGAPIGAIPIRWQDPIGGDEAGRRIIRSNYLDHEPRPRVQLAPEYPAELRSQGIEGTVIVEFWVDETGMVHNPVALKSDHARFEEAALRAIAKWRFEPGYYHGHKVRFRMSVPVVFRLSED